MKDTEKLLAEILEGSEDKNRTTKKPIASSLKAASKPATKESTKSEQDTETLPEGFRKTKTGVLLGPDHEVVVDPVTGQEYVKIKNVKNSPVLGGGLPQVKIPGKVVVWASNIDGDVTISNMLSRGYMFVDPKQPGCAVAAQRPQKGLNNLGQPLYHVAMMIDEDKHWELVKADTKKKNYDVNQLEAPHSDSPYARTSQTLYTDFGTEL